MSFQFSSQSDTLVEPDADPGVSTVSTTRDAVGSMWMWRLGKRLLQVVLPVAVIVLVWREVHTLDLSGVWAVLREADVRLAAGGVAVAFLSVAVMGLYDAVAFPRGVSGSLTFAKRWLFGLVLFAWTNFISMAAIGGPAIRVYAYRRFGLTGAEITRGFVGHYIGSSAGVMACLLAAWLPGVSGIMGNIIRAAIGLLAALMIALVVGRLVIVVLRRHHYGSELVGIPLARLALVSFLDWGLTLLSFDLLIRSVGIEIDPTDSARTVFTGQFTGIVSMIPGGLGSADAVWFKGFDLLGIPHHVAAAGVMLFRAGFYLLPWLAASVVIFLVVVQRSDRLRR